MEASFALLSAAELQLLRRFAFGARPPLVVNSDSDALIRHKLVKVLDGKPILTILDYARLVIEISRTSWAEARRGTPR